MTRNTRRGPYPVGRRNPSPCRARRMGSRGKGRVANGEWRMAKSRIASGDWRASLRRRRHSRAPSRQQKRSTLNAQLPERETAKERRSEEERQWPGLGSAGFRTVRVFRGQPDSLFPRPPRVPRAHRLPLHRKRDRYAQLPTSREGNSEGAKERRRAAVARARFRRLSRGSRVSRATRLPLSASSACSAGPPPSDSPETGQVRSTSNLQRAALTASAG